MHNSYRDILDRIDEEPVWWTSNGVPRWCDTDPLEVGVYDECVIFAEIACQSCDKRFIVGEGYTKMQEFREKAILAACKHESVDDIVLSKSHAELLEWHATHYHYGDPPNHGCVGDSMNCIDIQIIGAYVRNPDWKDFVHLYIRVHNLEGPIKVNS